MEHGLGHELGHDEGAEGGHGGNGHRRTALLISVLALVLALAETCGKSSQTVALSANVEASNLWQFYQAKTIRQTTLRTASDTLALEALGAGAEAKEAIARQREKWAATVERYESEPSTGEGRTQLMARAKAAEERREHALAAYHHFELASAGLQIAVVLASARIITGMAFLTWIAMGLGAAGVVFCAIGAFAPLAIHLF